MPYPATRMGRPRLSPLLAMLVMMLLIISCAPIMISEATQSARRRNVVNTLRAMNVIEPERSATVGLLLDENGIVTDVIGDSPARLARIKTGDEIVTIDGVPSKDIDTGEALIGPPGSTVTLLVLRNGKHKTYTLERAQWWDLMFSRSQDDEEYGDIDARPGY